MDAPNMHTMLDTLSALRVAYADLPAAQLAAILPQLDPETAARVQGIITECDEREAHLKAEIAQQEAAITAAVLATSATAQGTHLQAIITAPRVTWDHKGMATSAALHPEVLTDRTVGEPRVPMRARRTQRICRIEKEEPSVLGTIAIQAHLRHSHGDPAPDKSARHAPSL